MTDQNSMNDQDSSNQDGQQKVCSDFEWMIGPLVDGELPVSEVESAEEHLRRCPSCTRLAEEFRSFDRLARSCGQPPAVSPGEWEQVLGQVRREPTVIRLGTRRGVLHWLAPVLSLAALALLGAWIAFGVINKPLEINPNARKILQDPQSEKSETDREEMKKKGERG